MGQTSHKNDQIIQPDVSKQQRVERNPEREVILLCLLLAIKTQKFFNFEFAHAMLLPHIYI